MKPRGLLLCAAAVAALAGVSCRRPERGARTLRIASPYEIDTLDPHARDRLSSFSIASNFYEPLVTMTPDLQIEPALAVRWSNPDPSTWVFTLRRGVRFHDGSALTSADVVATFRRVLGDPSLEMGSYLHDVESIEPRGADVVVFRTRRPLAIFLNQLRFILVVPRGATRAQLAAGEDGTGPYRLERWEPGKSIVLRRYGRYWGPPPAFARVEYELSQRPPAVFRWLSPGGAQLVQCNTRGLTAAVAGAPDYALVHRTNIFTKYVGFDLTRTVTPYCSARTNPFRDLRVRRAVGLAIDRGDLISRLDADAVPAAELIPPFIFGYAASAEAPPHDLAQARRLMAEAGFGKGFSATMLASENLRAPAEALVEQLSAIGIRVEAKVVPVLQYYRERNERGAALYVGAFGCPTGDASDFLDDMVHSPDPARRFGLNNFEGIADAELDREIEASAGIYVPAERAAALGEIMARLSRETFYVPLYYDEDVYAVARRLRWRPRGDSFILASEVGRASGSR